MRAQKIREEVADDPNEAGVEGEGKGRHHYTHNL
jgi:hypothetical protein